MKTFDFDSIEFSKHGTAYQEFVRANHDKPVTLEQFIQLYRTTAHSGRHRSPSYARGAYKQLREKYGFFPTSPNERSSTQ